MKRAGAIAVTINVWDLDLDQFLDLKKHQGDPEQRAYRLSLGVNVDDVFMSRLKDAIENNVERTYTKFDPYDVSDLCDLYGEEFRIKYEEHEERFLKNPTLYNPNTEVVDVKSIARVMIGHLTEIGYPYWTFVDNINNANPYPELGKIRTGNLCQEVMLPANEKQVAVCNLGSINFAKINGDEELLKKSVHVLGRFLDNAIDNTTYPHEFAEHTQLNYRASGMGVMGEAEYLAKNKIMFGSDKHLEEIDRLYGIMDRETRAISKALAEEKGSCVIPGVRNAYRMCVAPNTTTGLYASTTSGCEPVYGRKWIEVKNKIPSVPMTPPDINIDNYEYYVPAFEIDQFTLLKCTARRQKYIDMSISHSVFFDQEIHGNGLTILKEYIYAWENGIKSLYYLRSKKKENKDLKNVEITCSGCAN